MLSPSLIASVFVMHWLVTMSPGPNTVLVTQTAVASGRANAFAVITGICASGAIWVTSAALGLNAIFLAFPYLHAFVSYLGAGYLIWLGTKLVLKRAQRMQDSAVIAAPEPLTTSFIKGFASNITNPKTLIYFSSVFGTLMPLNAGATTIMAVVLITWTCNFGWYGGLSVFLSAASMRRLYIRAAQILDRVAGLAMILFGIRIGVSRS
jgi:threonine/homoserine/homoserine lactone efflux protein